MWQNFLNSTKSNKDGWYMGQHWNWNPCHKYWFPFQSKCSLVLPNRFPIDFSASKHCNKRHIKREKRGEKERNVRCAIDVVPTNQWYTVVGFSLWAFSLSYRPTSIIIECLQMIGKEGASKMMREGMKRGGAVNYILIGIYANCNRSVFIYPVDQILFTCIAWNILIAG